MKENLIYRELIEVIDRDPYILHQQQEMCENMLIAYKVERRMFVNDKWQEACNA